MTTDNDKPDSSTLWIEESVIALNRRLAATEFLLVALLARVEDPDAMEKTVKFMVDSVDESMPWKKEFEGYINENLQTARNVGKVKS